MSALKCFEGLHLLTTAITKPTLGDASRARIPNNPFPPLSPVSIDDIDSVRMGRQSEGLNKHTDTSVEEQCFSIIFKARKKNLDLMAPSREEAKRWVSGLNKIINNLHNLSRQQKSEQYP